MRRGALRVFNERRGEADEWLSYQQNEMMGTASGERPGTRDAGQHLGEAIDVCHPSEEMRRDPEALKFLANDRPCLDAVFLEQVRIELPAVDALNFDQRRRARSLGVERAVKPDVRISREPVRPSTLQELQPRPDSLDSEALVEIERLADGGQRGNRLTADGVELSDVVASRIGAAEQRPE
jgi:hypothetical protein